MPIIVAGCKLDLRGDHNATSLEEVMGPIMQQFREIETCVECSATTMIQVHQDSRCLYFLFPGFCLLSQVMHLDCEFV